MSEELRPAAQPPKPATVINLHAPEAVPGSMVDYALRYARIGWAILPCWWIVETPTGRACACGNADCPSPGKHPLNNLVRHGQTQASTDPQVIREWWGRYPDANIGSLLSAAKLVAIDIDPRNGGLFTIEAIEAQHGPLDSGWVQFTGGGGEHRIFSAPPDNVSLPGKLGPGVDIKANGYIMLEPSSHLTGKTYVWEASSSPIDGTGAPWPLPDWLRDLAVRRLEASVAPAAHPADDKLLCDLLSALPSIPADDRDTWLQVGFALHNDVGGQGGFDLWDKWSKTSDKYDPRDQTRVWRSFKRKGIAGVTSATVFHLAQQHGWVNGVDLPPPVHLEDLPPPAPPPAAPGIPAHLLTIPGQLGRAVEWINATARKPQPLFAVQAALALGSTVAGRRYKTDNDNWTALYFLNIGPSGSGKEHAKFAVEKLLTAANLTRLIGVSRFASEASVVSKLIEKPTQFSVIDEFGKRLQSAVASGNFAARDTYTALMEVWPRADGVLLPVAYSTAALTSKQAEDLAKRTVHKPSLTLLCMSTGDTLFRGLTSEAVADGFLNRLLIVTSEEGRKPSRMVLSTPPPAALASWLGQVRTRGVDAGNLAAIEAGHDLEPVPIVVPFSAPAAKLLAAFEAANCARADQLELESMAEIPQRWTEIAMRLALIVAISNGHDQINPADAQWAIDYVQFHGERTIDQLRKHLSDGPFDALAKAVCNVLREAGPRGFTEREIGRKSPRWRSAPPRMGQEVLAKLVREEAIERIETAGARGGKKRIAWRETTHTDDQSSR